MEMENGNADDDNWRCDNDECRNLNSNEKIRCSECGEKRTVDIEDEIKTSSSVKDITENMNFRFPRRTIPY